MSDRADTETPSSKDAGGRPRSALSNAYERIRQFVRPRTKQASQTEQQQQQQQQQRQQQQSKDCRDAKTQINPGSPAAPAVVRDRKDGGTRQRGLAFTCDRQRRLQEEKAKSPPSSTGKTHHQQHAAVRSRRGKRRGRRAGKHRRRRAYARQDSEDGSSSSSSGEADSDDSDAVDNRDLWFLTRQGIELEKKLGEGTYAQVHAGRQAKPARPVAVKIISLEKTNQRFRVKFLPRETELLRKVNHPNVIRLYDTLKYENKVFFVMELVQRGDLLGYIQRHKVLSIPVARAIFSQVLDAMDYLHRNGIYHRDLKCENILLDPGHRVKLTDFGFAREWYEPYRLCRTYCGSAAYASPEILQGLPYEPSTADVWSMGIVLFIMVQGKMPFDDSDVKQMVSTILRYDVSFFSKRPLCGSLKTLIRAILNHGQCERATIGQIRRSAWMDGSKNHLLQT